MKLRRPVTSKSKQTTIITSTSRFGTDNYIPLVGHPSICLPPIPILVLLVFVHLICMQLNLSLDHAYKSAGIHILSARCAKSKGKVDNTQLLLHRVTADVSTHSWKGTTPGMS